MERKYCSACSERYCPIEEIKLNAQINIFASLLKSSDEKSSDENSPPPPKKKYIQKYYDYIVSPKTNFQE